MDLIVNKKEPVTFSPALRAEDALANYWLRQVTVRLRREVCWCWHERGVLPDSGSATLPPFVDRVSAVLDMSRFWEEKNRFYRSDPTARYLTDQLEVDPPQVIHPVRGSFSWVVESLDLDDTSSFILALGLVVAFDSSVGTVIASCLNDPSRTHPNLALAQKLWDYPEQVLMMSDPAHPLFRYGLLMSAGQPTGNYSGVDWESSLAVPPLVVSRLLFPDGPLPHVLNPVTVEGYDGVTLTDDARLVASRLKSETESSEIPNPKSATRIPHSAIRVVPVRGSKGSAYVETMCAVAGETGRGVVEFRGDVGLLENGGYMNSLATFCWLRGVDLFFNEHAVSSLVGDKHHPNTRLLPLQSIPITLFLGITERSQLSNIPGNLLMPVVDVPRFSYAERIRYWEKTLGKNAEGLGGAISECSRRFRYEKGTISAISEGLRGLGKTVTEKDLFRACRAELELDMGELAERVVPRFRDEELILPHSQHVQFREILKAMKSLTEVHYGWGTGKVWNESGISVLFAGPPGTGKTMAAEILAVELDLPMYRIDLSQVVNKYIGETEKNLKRLFDAADVSDTILFFDEADSLFGRRTEVKDAHDRYANLEVSYLLERMERFKGLAILATNRKKDIDEAFLRRLRYILDFPLPGAEQRKKIWRQVVPKTVDSSKLDFEFLARQFPLAGGHIRSIVFNACLQSADGSDSRRDDFKGALSMEQVIVAVKREYDKLGRSVSLEQFGPYAKIIERMEHE